MNNTVDINRNNIKSININNLLQLDNIEEFLNSLVYKISKQDDMIQQLQNKCIQLEKEKYGNDNIYETDNMLYKMISKINNRLDNVEEKLLLQSQDITTILSQFEVIIHKELPLLVKLQDYNSELLTMKSHYNEELQKLYEYAVPVQISNHYENIQNDILDRLSHVETNVLPRKIDRSEFQQVEILVNKLKVYDNFKYNTNMALEKIDEDIKVFHENFSTTSYHIATLQDHLKKVNHTQEESIISTENQIKALKEKIIEHEISIKNSTTKEAGEEMSRVLEMAQVQLQELQRCRLSHETKIENVEKELQQCAKSCDVKQLYVLRKHYEEVVTALGLELDVKASLEQFQSVDTKIAVSFILVQ